MGSNLDKSLRQKKTKMKFSPALLFAVAAADDKKVPPRHPLQRLNRLTEFTDELLSNWFTFLPSKEAWIAKFSRNAERMARNFSRIPNDVVSMMKNNFPTVAQPAVNDVKLMMLIVTTVKTHLKVSDN